MQKKKLTLSREDQRAIDAVLNHGVTTQMVPLGEVAHPPKISAVSKLLALLDSIPASDPPAGLLDRTMQRIENIEGRSVLPGSSPSSTRAIHLH